MQPSQILQGSWRVIPPEVHLNILRSLPNKALQAIATTARAENELAHSRECHHLRRATLRAIRIDWSVTGPSLFRHNLAFFSTFPHISAENHLKLLQWDASDFAESLDPEVTGTSEPQLRPCIRDRWLTQEEGQKLLVELIEAEDLETVKLLLASGIRPTPTALQKAIEVSEEYAEALLHAGARPSIDDLTTALETRDDDEGELFVLLLRWAPSSADDLLSELGDNPDETIGCLPATGGVRPTYWDCIEKTGTLLEELDHLLETAQSGALDSKCLYPYICEASPLAPCLRKVLDSPLPDPAVCQLLEFLIARRAKVTQEILEAGLRRGSEACLKVLFEKSDVVPTTWMLERAIVIEKQRPQLLQALITRGAKPSQFALELAIEHAPSLVPPLMKGLQSPWKRALIKAAYFLKKWPAWKIQPADQLPILNLVCLWQPKNVELLGQLLQNMTLTAPKLSPLFFRALRRHHADTVQTLLKHCPDLADQAITKAIGTSTGSVTALVKSGASIQRSHLVQALKQKPISEEIVLYLLEQERPIDEDLFTLAAKYGTPAIIRRFRERGGLVAPHILEKAFRRSPFDPAVIEALRDNKLEPHMRRLVAFPIQQLLLKPATEVSPRDIKDLFILFSTSTKVPQTFSRNKGKERMRKAPSVSSVSPQDPPDLLIDCFLKLATQWPQQKVRAVLSGIASRRLVVERAGPFHDLALMEKLLEADPTTRPALSGVLIKHGESKAIKLLLKAGQPIPLHIVIELLRSPEGRSDPILSSTLSALTPQQHEQLYLHIIREISLTAPTRWVHSRPQKWKLLFTDDWCQALEVLVKKRINLSEDVLIAAASVSATKEFNLLQTLLPVWKGPIPPRTVIKAIGQIRGRSTGAETLVAQYAASGGNPEQLLIAEVQHGATRSRRQGGSGRQPLLLRRLLRAGLQPSDLAITHAIKSKSREAPEFVRTLIPPEATLKEEWLLAMAESPSPLAEEVALQLLLHPSAPETLPQAWITHLIDNPSPKAKKIFSWARKLTTIQGLNEDALRKAVQSPHPVSLAITELLISRVRPLPNDLLELAASNKQHGPKIVEGLLEMGYPITETAMWNAHNRITHQLLFRAHTTQLLKGEQGKISAPPPSKNKKDVEELTLPIYQWFGNADLTRLAKKLSRLRKLDIHAAWQRSEPLDATTFVMSFPELRELKLNWPDLEPGDLCKMTKNLPKLRKLSVTKGIVNADEFQNLAEHCPNLEELHLMVMDNELSIHDAGKLLRKLVHPELRMLELQDSVNSDEEMITDEGVLEALAKGCPKLEHVEFTTGGSDCFSAKDVEALAKSVDLKHADISLSSTDNEALKALTINSPHLETLGLDSLNDRQLQILSQNCPRLQKLMIWDATSATAKSWEALRKCTRLTTLKLTAPENEWLQALAAIGPQLQRVVIEPESPISNLQTIAHACPRLQDIIVLDPVTDTSVRIQGKLLKALSQGFGLAVKEAMLTPSPSSEMRKLTRRMIERSGNLHIPWNEIFHELPHDNSERIREFWRLIKPHPSWVPLQEVLNVSQRHVTKHPSLLAQMLNVIGTLEKEGITAFLRAFPDLTVLELGSSSLRKWLGPLSQMRPPVRELFCNSLSPDQIVPLARACPGLRRLSVSSSSATDAWMTALGGAFPNLTHVMLGHDSRVTVNGIRELLQSCAMLRTLRMELSRSLEQSDIEALRKQYPKVSIT